MTSQSMNAEMKPFEPAVLSYGSVYYSVQGVSQSRTQSPLAFWSAGTPETLLATTQPLLAKRVNRLSSEEYGSRKPRKDVFRWGPVLIALRVSLLLASQYLPMMLIFNLLFTRVKRKISSVGRHFPTRLSHSQTNEHTLLAPTLFKKVRHQRFLRGITLCFVSRCRTAQDRMSQAGRRGWCTWALATPRSSSLLSSRTSLVIRSIQLMEKLQLICSLAPSGLCKERFGTFPVLRNWD